MDIVGQIASYLYQYFDNFGFLLLSSVGLILIYGMMGVINMAHGELMMIGAYTAVAAYHAGVPIPVAVVFAGLGAGAAGILLEQLVIRHFYNQLLSSLVATWGISLILSQGTLLLLGPSTMNIPTPLGSVTIGPVSFGLYRFVMFLVAIGLIAAVWAVFRWTRLGAQAQATMENPAMARALGIDTRNVYMLTFGLGSALGGIAGGMFAMTAPVSPFFGADYTPMAFITVVIGGGANAILGLLDAGLYLAGVETISANVFNEYIGYVSVMAAAFVALLVMPSGISDFIERRRLQARRS